MQVLSCILVCRNPLKRFLFFFASGTPKRTLLVRPAVWVSTSPKTLTITETLARWVSLIIPQILLFIIFAFYSRPVVVCTNTYLLHKPLIEVSCEACSVLAASPFYKKSSEHLTRLPFLVTEGDIYTDAHLSRNQLIEQIFYPHLPPARVSQILVILFTCII